MASLLDLSMGMDPEQTGWENIILRAIFPGMSFAEAKALVPEIAEFLNWSLIWTCPCAPNSSGMVMRLSFGVSTAIRPDIILMDGMISVGDVCFATKARARLQVMLDKVGILVIASHSSATLRKYCDRAVWLKEGRIVIDGPLEDVLVQAHRPP